MRSGDTARRVADPTGLWSESFAWSSRRIGYYIWAVRQPLLRGWVHRDDWPAQRVLARHTADVLAGRLMAHEMRGDDELGAAAPLTTYAELGLDPEDEHGLLVPRAELSTHIERFLIQSLQLARHIPVVASLAHEGPLTQLRLFEDGDTP